MRWNGQRAFNVLNILKRHVSISYKTKDFIMTLNGKFQLKVHHKCDR